MSKAIIDLHGGNISVDSRGENMGCCFTVRWPVGSPVARKEGETLGAESSSRLPALSSRKYVPFYNNS